MLYNYWTYWRTYFCIRGRIIIYIPTYLWLSYRLLFRNLRNRQNCFFRKVPIFKKTSNCKFLWFNNSLFPRHFILLGYYDLLCWNRYRYLDIIPLLLSISNSRRHNTLYSSSYSWKKSYSTIKKKWYHC